MENSDNFKFKHQLSWEDKAKLNPLYAIMSDDFLKSSSTDFKEEELEKFYDKGRKFWSRLFAPFFENNDALIGLTVIEYGAGMGRLLNQPAQFGAKCIGIDISENQLSNAKKYCPNAEKMEFKLLTPKKELDIKANSANLVYSYAVLQHIKGMSDFKFAINEMCRLTAPQGILKFQIRSLSRYLKSGLYSGYISIPFENFTLSFYLRKFLNFLRIPVVKIFSHTHWGGAGSFQSVPSVIRLLEFNNMKILNVEFDNIGNLVWITCTK